MLTSKLQNKWTLVVTYKLSHRKFYDRYICSIYGQYHVFLPFHFFRVLNKNNMTDAISELGIILLSSKEKLSIDGK